MALCGGPACTVPSCASTPVVGFGSAGYRGLGYGLGGLGYAYGAGETSANLGTLDGVIPSGINQIPPSEIVIRPPPVILTLPGPILSASCEPVSVGGNTPCAVGGSGIVSSRGLWGSGLYGNLGPRGNPCLPSPCLPC